jgi:hypothetical protein
MESGDFYEEPIEYLIGGKVMMHGRVWDPWMSSFLILFEGIVTVILRRHIYI